MRALMYPMLKDDFTLVETYQVSSTPTDGGIANFPNALVHRCAQHDIAQQPEQQQDDKGSNTDWHAITQCAMMAP